MKTKIQFDAHSLKDVKRSLNILSGIYSELINEQQTNQLNPKPIDELDLPTRVINSLHREGITTVGELKLNVSRLKDIMGIGTHSYNFIMDELKKYE